MRIDGSTILTVVLRDVTRRKRVEKEQRFLSEAGSILASSLDYDQTLANVGQLAVRELADWCIIEIVEADERLKRVKVVSADQDNAANSHSTQNLSPATGLSGTGDKSCRVGRDSAGSSAGRPGRRRPTRRRGAARRAGGDRRSPRDVGNCLASGDIPGVLGLFTADGIRRLLGERSPFLGGPAGMRVAIVSISQVERLPDGRIAARVAVDPSGSRPSR